MVSLLAFVVADIVLLLWGAITYNGLVRRKNLVAEAWSGIDAQLKRRADLIPNLVSVVKGYAAHEYETFDELARLRAAGQAQGGLAERAQTEMAISAALLRVLAVAEAYPELKASTNFQQLQTELANTEDQIQLARRYYNGTVRNYNILIEQFPSNLVARLGKFTPAPFFQIRKRLRQAGTDRDIPGMSRGAALILALLIGLTTFARADERITDFASDIRVAQTGALTVTETISVNSEDSAIRHGIFRDFPTVHDRQGRRVHVGFDVLSVTLDGHDEMYSVERIENGERVKIGDPKTEIPAGPHRFVLTYATDRQIGFYPGFDELYWNVTGNFWYFPIDHAEAIVELPGAAHILQYSAYTGLLGSSEQNAQSEKLSDSAVRFATSAPLGEKEGLTVAVGFSKGAVLPPSPAELRRDLIRDNAATIVASAGVLMMLIYFIAVWFEYGQRPARGTIIPLFAPPRDFSPAAVRFVHRMGYDRKAYAAALVDMAVKGYLRITEDHGVYTLTRTGKSDTETGLAHGEAAIASRLFADGDTIELKQINHTAVAESITALRISLAREYERDYFVTNGHWFVGGLAMLVVTGFGAAVLCDDPQAYGALVTIAVACFATSFFAHLAWDAWHVSFSGPGSAIANALRAILVTGMFSIALFLSWSVGIMQLAHSVPLPVTIALCGGGVAAYIFYHLLKHPTLLGAPIMDQIDGFKMFLATAEKDRLEVLNPPNVTPAVFEKFLPYAIALDCENQWSRKFEAEAAAAGIAQASNGSYYTPGWYSGSSFNSLGTAGFANAIGTSMASAVASAASTPGSGGGGSSGGGGGGGGGGGW